MYTEKELQALRIYTERESTFDFNKKYGAINRLLRYLNRDGMRDKTLPLTFTSIEDFKECLINITNLFILLCKYGNTHEVPYICYRGDRNAATIKEKSVINNQTLQREWTTDAFLSCSKKLSETEVFAKDGPKIIVTTNTPKGIPFVDVNDLLGSDQQFGDEAEILFAPFLTSIVKDTSLLEYNIEIEDKMELADSFVYLDDDFLDKYIQLSQKVKDEHAYDGEDSMELDNMRKNLRDYLKNNFCKIHSRCRMYSAGLMSEEDFYNEVNFSLGDIINQKSIEEGKSLR